MAFERQKSAVLTIENCWCVYRDRQMFNLLRYAICSADHSLTYDIMRKINPSEADLLNDPVFHANIRFRFAGEEFPPYVVFKVFIKTNGQGVKYLSGKKAILPASEAAMDACNLMGNRKFLEQMTSDLYEEQQNQINSELDVSSLKDYMKYLSLLDETTAGAGGKGNTWRKLNLECVPRQNIIYDVLTFLQQGKKSDKLLRFVSPSQTQQVENINELIRRKSPNKLSEPTRRSKQARERVAKMERLYKMERLCKGAKVGIDTVHSTVKEEKDSEVYDESFENTKRVDINFNDDSWDEEGQLLFEWTQNLCMEKITSSTMG